MTISLVSAEYTSTLGNYREALDYYDKVLLAAEEHGYMDILQSALNDLGILYMDQADFVKATALFTRSLNIANTVGDREAAAITTCNLGVSSERQGMYETAGQSFGDCLRLANHSARLDLTIPALEGLGTVYRQKGQHKLALEYYDQGSADCHGIG